MKIVKIIGGLGNQMFQYALYLALKEKFPAETVKIDLSCFNGYPLHNGFELNKIFHLDYESASFKDLLKLAYPYSHYRCWQIGKYILPKRKSMYIEKSSFHFDPEVFSHRGDCYYDGYWQAIQYYAPIREDIIKLFAPIEYSDYTVSVLKSIDEINSVGIHVRRGDYLKVKDFAGICDLEYYKNAIEYLKQHYRIDKFFIFSNDLQWCGSNIIPLLDKYDFELVSGNIGKNSYMDMFLMSHCKYLIMANSSFSWWGAFLNQREDKEVLAPAKWTNTRETPDIYDKTWVRI